jgi:hypothetical protein
MFRCVNLKFSGCYFSSLTSLDDRVESTCIRTVTHYHDIRSIKVSLYISTHLKTILMLQLTSRNFNYWENLDLKLLRISPFEKQTTRDVVCFRYIIVSTVRKGDKAIMIVIMITAIIIMMMIIIIIIIITVSEHNQTQSLSSLTDFSQHIHSPPFAVSVHTLQSPVYTPIPHPSQSQSTLYSHQSTHPFPTLRSLSPHSTVTNLHIFLSLSNW